MKSRITLLMALLTIAGVMSAMAPSQAGPWMVRVQFKCKVKIKDGTLTYPSLGDAQNRTFSVECGKNKPKKHPSPAGNLDHDFCHMSAESPNGKKGPVLKTKPAPKPPTEKPNSNCNLNISAGANGKGTVVGNCGLSQGTGLARVTNKVTGKTIFVSFTWVGVGGELHIVGTAGKTKGANDGNVFGEVTAVPDRVKKGHSCTDGASQFKVLGGLGIGGNKTK